MATMTMGLFSAAELVELQAKTYERWGNGLGDLMAKKLRELKAEIAATGTVDPAEHESRLNELWEASRAPAFEDYLEASRGR